MENGVDSEDYGLVYVLTNPAMPGLVKIGMTQRSGLEQRMRELYGTGVPVPFKCEYACKVKKSDTKQLEQALHTAFKPQRVNPQREFFAIEPEQAVAILRFCDEGDVTQEVSNEINSELTPEERNVKEHFSAPRRPVMNYMQMGLPPGSILTYRGNPAITVCVVNERKVLFEGDECSLTAATKKIQGIETGSLQPAPYWLYNNESLQTLYDRAYPIEE